MLANQTSPTSRRRRDISTERLPCHARPAPDEIVDGCDRRSIFGLPSQASCERGPGGDEAIRHTVSCALSRAGSPTAARDLCGLASLVVCWPGPRRGLSRTEPAGAPRRVRLGLRGTRRSLMTRRWMSVSAIGLPSDSGYSTGGERSGAACRWSLLAASGGAVGMAFSLGAGPAGCSDVSTGWRLRTLTDRWANCSSSRVADEHRWRAWTLVVRRGLW